MYKRQLPDGAKVAISDDASNLSANLHSLEFLGLIELKDIPEGSYYTTFDITKNPKNLEFVEVEMNSKYAILDDVDIAMVFYSNKSAEKYQCNILKILDDDPVVAFPVIVAVDCKNKDQQWVKDMMEAMTGEEMKAKPVSYTHLDVYKRQYSIAWYACGLIYYKVRNSKRNS